MGIDYKNAPVSEVIIGITWKEPLLKQSYFKILERLGREIPDPQVLAPLGDELYDKDRGRSLNLNPVNTGPSLYRFKKDNDPWLIQVQYNKFYINWIRNDDWEVGKYPGYQVIKTRFFSELEKLDADVLNPNFIKSQELTYQDRFEMQQPEKDISRTINAQYPAFHARDISNVFSETITVLDDLSGFGSVTVHTHKSLQGKNMFILNSSIHGYNEKLSANLWLDKAHGLQLDLFKYTFTDSIKEEWRGI